MTGGGKVVNTCDGVKEGEMGAVNKGCSGFQRG